MNSDSPDDECFLAKHGLGKLFCELDCSHDSQHVFICMQQQFVSVFWNLWVCVIPLLSP